MSDTVPPDLGAALALLRSLIETRTFRKERLGEAGVRDAIATLGRFAAAGNPAERLTALSMLGKAAEISKPIAAAVESHVKGGLREELPPLDAWGNAEDRFYLAKAVATADYSWIWKYSAEQLARAEINEKLSRDMWAELAIGRAASLAESLNTITTSLAAWLAAQGDAADLAYRKLVRVIEGLSHTLLTADVPTGGKFGVTFTSMIGLAGGGTGSATLRLREEAAVATLDLMIQVLRLRYETRFDSDMYRAVGTVRGWWRPARPPQAVEDRTDRIARLAVEALHVLARQGVQDNELRRALVKALDQARVNAAGTALAKSDLGLTPHASHWLATGQELVDSQSNEVVQELNDRDLDELIARLLLTIMSQDVSPSALANVADSIELFEAVHASTIRTAVSRLEVARQWIEALSAKRRLVTFGVKGDVVAYDSLVHDATETLQRQSDVRIAVPGVIRTKDSRSPIVILKAIVQKL